MGAACCAHTKRFSYRDDLVVVNALVVVVAVGFGVAVGCGVAVPVGTAVGVLAWVVGVVIVAVACEAACAVGVVCKVWSSDAMACGVEVGVADCTCAATVTVGISA